MDINQKHFMDWAIFNLKHMICVYLTDHSSTSWMWHKANFKRNMAGFNSEFSIS